MSFYPEFQHQPSRPHQCIYVNTGGARCRSFAMRNKYTCYHHQIEDMPDVISNDAFPIPRPQDRAGIQQSIADVIERLAANQIDPKRASTLLYGLQLASSNLRDKLPKQSEAATTALLESAAAANAPFNPSDLFTGIFAPNRKPATQVSEIGRDFSPAINPLAIGGALAPETCPPASGLSSPQQDQQADDAGPVSIDIAGGIPASPALASRYPEASASGLSPHQQDQRALAPGCAPHRRETSQMHR